MPKPAISFRLGWLGIVPYVLCSLYRDLLEKSSSKRVHLGRRCESTSYPSAVIERNVDSWTQSSSFMDAFARRALRSSRFVRPVAKFIRRSVEQQADEIEQERKPLDSPFPFPETPSASSKPSDNNRRCKHAKFKRADSESALEDAKVRKERK